MIATNHILTGIGIGLLLKEPLIVAPVAFISHFVLDVIPHFGNVKWYLYGHRHFPKVMALDGIAAAIVILIVMWAVPDMAWAIAIGGGFAVLPDIFWLHYYGFGKPEHWFYKFHQHIQWYERAPGAFVELCYLLFISMTVITLLGGS